MRRCGSMVSVAVILAFVLTGCGQVNEERGQKDGKATEIMVWNYYSGVQQETFGKLTEEFNQTRGEELGIVVKTSSEGSVGDLEINVMDAIHEEVGAKELPNIFAAYADTAYKVEQEGMLVDLNEYLTEDEKDEYIPSYLEEGAFSGDGSIKIFPVAKATEVFMLNKTDWDRFSEATGTQIDACSTIEGLTEVGRKYYEWTDSLTDTPDDGKAFFGRDAMANYMLVGAAQLGQDILQKDEEGNIKINLEKKTARKLWDNYYVPYINGYFTTVGRFRTDDIKTGDIIALVGSSAGATFFPNKVLKDEEGYDIETLTLPAPQFAESEGYAIQQGAGMSVLQGEQEEVKASVEFLKWFAEPEQNIQFSVHSGYIPVKKVANDIDVIEEQLGGETKTKEVLEVSVDTIQNNELYTAPAFASGSKVREILEQAMSDRAKEDRTVIIENMKAGKSKAESVAQFDTDEKFEQWYKTVRETLEKTIK